MEVGEPEPFKSLDCALAREKEKSGQKDLKKKIKKRREKGNKKPTPISMRILTDNYLGCEHRTYLPTS